MLRSIYNLFMVAMLVTLPIFLLASSLHAQIEHNPAVRITKIDPENFPEVKVYLRGENLGRDLSALSVTLYENSEEVEVLSDHMAEDVGAQTMFLLDASGIFLNRGFTRKKHFVEVGEVTSRFVKLGGLSEADWLAAYASGPSEEIKKIQDWTQDHQAAANSVYQNDEPDDDDLNTALYDLIYLALDRFEEGDVPDNAAKRIVLFSDGVDYDSDVNFEDVVNRAEEKNVPIYTVLLGEKNNGKEHMTNIAKSTGGEMYQITSLEALDELWISLAREGKQRVLTYRSRLVQPKQVRASVTLSNKTTVSAIMDFPAITVQSVQIEILEPTSDSRIIKEVPEHNTPLEELEPKTIDIQVEFSWPDGKPRNLKRVDYAINDHTKSYEPFERVRFPIDSLESGYYTIRVMAIDELGLKGESPPVTFRVDVSWPDPPTPSPPSLFTTPTPLTYQIPGIGPVPQSRVNNAGLAALVLAVLVVVIILWNPTIQRQVANVVTGTIGIITEPFRLQKDIKATLVVENPAEGTSWPAKFDIRGGTTKIGRASILANFVIKEPRISRLHCRITEEPNGKFRLYNESKSRETYVNSEMVDTEGQVLESDDLINVGPVELRFHYKSDSANPRTEPFRLGNEKQTDPMRPTIS